VKREEDFPEFDPALDRDLFRLADVLELHAGGRLLKPEGVESARAVEGLRRADASRRADVARAVGAPLLYPKG
jgi:hypothetical protein